MTDIFGNAKLPSSAALFDFFFSIEVNIHFFFQYIYISWKISVGRCINKYATLMSQANRYICYLLIDLFYQ